MSASHRPSDVLALAEAPEHASVDFPVFETFGRHKVPAAILGDDLLGRTRLALDDAGARLLSWMPAGT